MCRSTLQAILLLSVPELLLHLLQILLEPTIAPKYPPTVVQHTALIILQVLSTCRLTEQQAADTTLDLLTGFHMVDGRERLVVLEGVKGGKGLSVVEEVSWWSQEEVQVEPGWVPRHVIYNRDIGYGYQRLSASHVAYVSRSWHNVCNPH